MHIQANEISRKGKKIKQQKQREKKKKKNTHTKIQSHDNPQKDTCSSVKYPNFIPASFKLVPSLCAVLAILAALSYPILGFKAVTSIKDSFKSCEMRFSLAVIPLTQCSTKEELASARRRIEWSRLRIRTGL